MTSSIVVLVYSEC